MKINLKFATMSKLIAAAALAATLAACGGDDKAADSAPHVCYSNVHTMKPCETDKPRDVVKFGDSITADEGQGLVKYLPQGSVVDNRGVYGATALHMLLNDMPAWTPTKVYVVSYGANECLHGFETSLFIGHMKSIIGSAKAAGVLPIVEAPWRMTSCLERIDGYRAALKVLSAEMGVPLVDGDLRQDSSGDGIHLNPEHSEARMALVAQAVKSSPQ
jgi:hypothetical protein